MAESLVRCTWCGRPIVRVSIKGGHGSYWVEDLPDVVAARMCAPGELSSPYHRPDLPVLTDEEDVEYWLDEA